MTRVAVALCRIRVGISVTGPLALTHGLRGVSLLASGDVDGPVVVATAVAIALTMRFARALGGWSALRASVEAKATARAAAATAASPSGNPEQQQQQQQHAPRQRRPAPAEKARADAARAS